MTWKHDYMHEKIGQALSSLVLTEDPESIASAFEIINRCDDQPPLEDEKAAGWWAKIQSFLEVTPDDETHPKAKENGCWWVRAQRLSRDDKRELGDALWELHGYLEEQYYLSLGED